MLIDTLGREGLEEEIYPTPDPRFAPLDELRTILGKTKGVPFFQEQAMMAADFTPAKANALRKSMATFRHQGTIELLQDQMVERMVARGYERDFFQSFLSQIKGLYQTGCQPQIFPAFFNLSGYRKLASESLESMEVT